MQIILYIFCSKLHTVYLPLVIAKTVKCLPDAKGNTTYYINFKDTKVQKLIGWPSSLFEGFKKICKTANSLPQKFLNIQYYYKLLMVCMQYLYGTQTRSNRADDTCLFRSLSLLFD